MEHQAEKVPMNPGINPCQEAKQVDQSVSVTALPVRDHLLWSIFNFVYMNFCCLGFVALIYSVKARDRKVVGDVDGSRHYASAARSYNIAATVLTIILCVIYIALRIAIISRED
ncbi:dispanin subfamily A member 2b-like [Mustelus asterias]